MDSQQKLESDSDSWSEGGVDSDSWGGLGVVLDVRIHEQAGLGRAGKISGYFECQVPFSSYHLHI